MELFISELLGTFLLVAAVLLTTNPIYITLAFLAAILLANISGGHINPIITMVKSMQGAISNKQVFEYISAQMSGAVIALILVKHFKNV